MPATVVRDPARPIGSDSPRKASRDLPFLLDFSPSIGPDGKKRVPTLAQLRAMRRESQASASTSSTTASTLLDIPANVKALYADQSTWAPANFSPKPTLPHPVLRQSTVAGSGGLTYALSNRAYQTPLPSSSPSSSESSFGSLVYNPTFPGRDLGPGSVLLAGVVSSRAWAKSSGTSSTRTRSRDLAARFTPQRYSVLQLGVYWTGDVYMRVKAPFDELQENVLAQSSRRDLYSSRNHNTSSSGSRTISNNGRDRLVADSVVKGFSDYENPNASPRSLDSITGDDLYGLVSGEEGTSASSDDILGHLESVLESSDSKR